MTKTQSAYISGFARGITEAISDSAFHSPSSMTARAIRKNALTEDLSEEFGVPEDEIKLVKADITLSDHLARLGWDRENTWNLGRRLGFVIGKPQELWFLEDDAEILDAYSGCEDGGGPFYFIEEVFVAVYEEVALLFIIGNDE